MCNEITVQKRIVAELNSLSETYLISVNVTQNISRKNIDDNSGTNNFGSNLLNKYCAIMVIELLLVVTNLLPVYRDDEKRKIRR